MIRKLNTGGYRLYSHKVDPRTGGANLPERRTQVLERAKVELRKAYGRDD